MRALSATLLILLGACAVVADDLSPASAIEVATGTARAPAKLQGEFSACEVLRASREMMPSSPIELTGALVLRNRKGIVSREYGYRLVMRRTADASLLTVRLAPRDATNELACVMISRRGKTRPSILLSKEGGAAEPVVSSLERVMDTDVTWLDLTFDFLWWTDASFETEREGETVHGQTCAVILVRPPEKIEGLGAIRLWVDKKMGCLMQAEQLDEDMKAKRRLWGTRVKKFDGRWMVSVLEVETLGSRHRTKITVESLKELP